MMTSPVIGPLASPPLRAGTPPPIIADRIIRARKGGNPTQIILSEMAEEEIALTIDALVAANGLTDAFLLNAVGPHTKRLNLTCCYHIRKYSLHMIAQQCRNLESINLTNCRQVDNKLIHGLLLNCPNLHTLVLEGCVRVTDAAFFPPDDTPQPDLSRLSVLSLAGCRQISEDALLRIANQATGLCELNLSGCRNSVTGSVLGALMDSNLKSLDVSDCAVLASDEGFLDYFSPNRMVPLERLKLTGLSGLPPKYTWRTVQAVAMLCGPHLVELDTTWSASVNDAACYALANNCPNLQRLGFCNAQVSPDGIDILTTNLEKLESLDLSWCIRTNARAIDTIAMNAIRLKKLCIAHCVDFLRPDSPTAINPRTIVSLLRNNASLEQLDLTGIPRLVTGQVLEVLSESCDYLNHFSGSLGGDSALHALIRLGAKAANLTHLWLDVSRVTEDLGLLTDAFRYPNFPSLQKLTIVGSSKNSVSNDLLEAILVNRTGLEHLELRSCADITQDLFHSWIKGYSPDKETTLLVEAMLDYELQRGYLSSTSRQTAFRCSDSEAAGTVVFQGRTLSRRRKLISSCSETETTMAYELLKNSLVLSDPARAMDGLKSLCLVGACKLTDASLDRLSLMTTYLQSLAIIDAPLVTEECVEPIRRRCRLLRSLEITGPKLSVRIDSSRFANRRHRRKATQLR